MDNGAISLAMTGASGAPYGLRLLESLLMANRQVYLMISPAAQVVMETETDLRLPGNPDEIHDYFVERFGCDAKQLRVFGREDWMAPVASGSNAPQAMVVCPCSAGSLSAIATGASNNLIERAADVMLKEGRKLIMLPREMPFSAIHLENMLKLAQLGVVIMPAAPGFYHHPETIDDMVDFVVARILDQLGVEHTLAKRWGEN